MLRRRAPDRRKKSRSPCKSSRTVNSFTSIRDSRFGVTVLKRSCARSPHELAGPERLIFSVIAVDLPPAQTAAGIHDLPSIAAEYLLHVRRLSLDNGAVAQTTLSRLYRSGETRDQNPTATGCVRSERIRVSTVVTNIIASVHWCNDPAEAFLLHRAQKIAWILSPAQTGFCNSRRIEAAFESEAGFFRCVIKSTDYEVFAVMSFRTPRQSFILMREPLDNFRPRNVCSEFRIGCAQTTKGCNPSDQSPKSDSIGPPIKTSMGSRFHSYS